MKTVDLEDFCISISDGLQKEYVKHLGWNGRKIREGMSVAAEVMRKVHEKYLNMPEEKMTIPEPRPIKPPPKPPECDHKFKDYSWYALIEDEQPGKQRYTIVEPYLCVKCGKRKDVMLEQGAYYSDDPNSHWALLEELKRKYPKLRNQAEVEDEITDDALVDREYLRIAEMLRNNREPQAIRLKLPLSQEGRDSDVQ